MVKDLSTLSDEELLNTPYEAPVTTEEVIEPVVEEVAPVVTQEVVEPVIEQEVTPVVVQPVEDNDLPVVSDNELKKPEKLVDPAKPIEPGAVTEPVVKATESAPAVDYEAVYKQIMAPFKANGKTIELKDPQEVIQLMQMGANYTRKMQDLQGVKKQLTMLENNGLLDEGKLSFLIDLDKKNPEAIKKLLKEANIDPLDLDIKAETMYKEGNHIVSDDEVKFRSVLDAVSATPEGKAALQVIHASWDQASKDALWASPDIMEVIAEQKTNGIYDRVAVEVDRQRTLGNIRQDVSFLTAYQSVGQLLGKQGAFNDLVQKPTAVSPVAAIATKVAQPKPVVLNNSQVAAAAPTRSANKRVGSTANLDGLTDEDFMKQFAGRL